MSIDISSIDLNEYLLDPEKVLGILKACEISCLERSNSAEERRKAAEVERTRITEILKEYSEESKLLEKQINELTTLKIVKEKYDELWKIEKSGPEYIEMNVRGRVFTYKAKELIALDNFYFTEMLKKPPSKLLNGQYLINR